ncbi:hypothetical protein PHYBLDRAFT_171266 [Phycomyces blakesleeanus NRRL 1555(-)]|uniref:Uncharacterized protein n=1 Tax=Phycomyces blakesleeanus (strain ATCC 8743b / DSM 1359 / FGSC 10004 / NBRC 33097 / NRRL 1555) TaxID=763407 RepID=A0A167LI82_PHYB8|nr:hypothetical protein PHYBLDRAFT_171266 [Phycomyces blakesleeanus NRRL 1555(-)]OAD70515.1 hypothetical protein PHYBLDRAFT_171266 [Phycomyces blakesleeanus NRRL 1555(-)]|eukprot:XP_018288555.1 hypothetical protein PHYBLDRAFT_171266 [Phycomyces blakesleeanus NRRL 1555(-)]
MVVSYYKYLFKSAYKENLKYINSYLLKRSKPKKPYKTTTRKSVKQTTGTAASTRQWEILPSLTVSAERDVTVLSALSNMSTRLNESHSLLEKVYHNMGATNGQNNISTYSPISQALITREYINCGRENPKTYFIYASNGKSFARKDSLTKADFLTLVQKDKNYKAIHLADKANLESKFGEAVVDLLDYDMLSDIELDEEKNKPRYTPRYRHFLVDEYFTVLKKQRLANKGPDVIGNSVYPIILRNIKLLNKKKARVTAWIHTRQQ